MTRTASRRQFSLANPQCVRIGVSRPMSRCLAFIWVTTGASVETRGRASLRPFPLSLKYQRIAKGKGEKISVGSAQTPEEEEEEDEIVETPKSIPAKKPSVYDMEKGNAGSEVHTSSPIVGVPQIERIQESARVSTGSTSSTKSFAFPVLVKDCSRREGPLKGDKGMKAESQPPVKPQSELESQMQQQQPETGAKAETSKETPPEATQSGCFTCFSCWPRCC